MRSGRQRVGRWGSARSTAAKTTTRGASSRAGIETGFDASAWSTATVTDGPGGLLIPAIAPDVQVIHEFTSVKATEVVPRRIVYDFGQNFAGRPQIKVEGPAGATLKLIPGDVLKADGTVTQLSSGGPMYWTYTLKGRRPGDVGAAAGILRISLPAGGVECRLGGKDRGGEGAADQFYRAGYG